MPIIITYEEATQVNLRDWGRMDREYGFGINDNPHTLGSESWRQWREGWFESDARQSRIAARLR
jgi:hypothetical protein